MSKIPYEIISTGSQGNAVVINNYILIDCGVSFRELQLHFKAFKLVLLTHTHSDHLNRSTVKILARERPTLRFACGRWLVKTIVECGVPKENIDILEPNIIYNYGLCNVIMFPLTHDVPNCGYKIHFPIGKVIYATDTNNLNGITARDYDLYMIEANYEDEVIQEKIKEKEASGEFAYEKRVLKFHLSKKKCDDFIYSNIGRKGEYVYMHCHRDKE